MRGGRTWAGSNVFYILSFKNVYNLSFKGFGLCFSTLKRRELGVTVHEFMLISICQCLCHLMIVSWSHGFIGFVVSVVSWFHRFRGVNSFIVS